MPYIYPQIEDAHREQNKLSGPCQHNRHYLSEEPSRRRVQVVGENPENCQRYVCRENEPSGGHQQRKPAHRSTPSPEYGAGRNREQQQLGVVETMINRQHGKSGDRR